MGDALSEAARLYVGVNTVPRIAVNAALTVLSWIITAAELVAPAEPWTAAAVVAVGAAAWGLGHAILALSSLVALVGRKKLALAALRLEAMAWWVLAGGLAIALGGAALRFPDRAQAAITEAKQNVAMVDTWVATRDLVPGDLIEAEDVHLSPTRGMYLPTDLHSAGPVIGRVVVSTVQAGERIRPGRLADAAPFLAVAAGHRLVPVQATVQDGLEVVDVIGTGDCAVASGVRVLGSPTHPWIEVSQAHASAVQAANDTGDLALEAPDGRPACSR